MLHFVPLTADHIPLLRADLARTVPRTCDYSVGGMVLWADFFDIHVAQVGASLIYRLRLADGSLAYQIPADPDPSLLERICEECRRRGDPILFTLVPEESRAVLDALGTVTHAVPQREWADYLYRKEDLIFYRGKKLRGQRNHVNKFNATFPDATFTVGTERDLPALREFYARFKAENRKDAPTWIAEEKKMDEIFDRFSDYGFLCGILWGDGRMLGFSFGETVGDTLFVHTEKADRNAPGAYSTLSARFTEAFADESIAYVNREDDSGDEGLRTAKLSYHPCAILNKYLVRIE